MIAALSSGDKIRIIAPSGVFPAEPFHAGVQIIEAMDLRPVFNEAIFARQGYLAGPDAQRLKSFYEALEDPEAKAIWIARGGYGATRLLPQIDVKRIAAAGKQLIGFSDTSALHAVWARAGLPSVHGPNVTTLATWTPEARQALQAILLGRGKGQALQGRGMGGHGVVRGALHGGNLTVLAAMAGTGFLPSWQGAVLLLEDVGEKPYRLDRCLTQLRQAGTFAGLCGFALGQFTDCGDDALAVVVATLKDLDLPIVAELPVDHDKTSRAVLLGATVELDAAQGMLRSL